MNVLVINGPNLNMLGYRPKEHYGSLKLDDINKLMEEEKGNLNLEFFQTNSEGDIVTKIQDAVFGKYDAIITLGAVIKGATDHYDYVCAEVSKGIALVSLESEIPVIFGVLTTVVSLATYYGLTLTILDPEKAVELQIANIISWIAAVTFAYFTNRKWVFENKEKANIKEASKFYLSRVSTLLIDMALMFIFVTKLGVNDKIMKLVVQVVVTILNYVFSKFIVFREKKNETK